METMQQMRQYYMTSLQQMVSALITGNCVADGARMVGVLEAPGPEQQEELEWMHQDIPESGEL